ncbi:MAG: riboflavin synthase [Actinobacteria bacterium]|nr:riboflavin synthase [Actinomycetota bacterium]
MFTGLVQELGKVTDIKVGETSAMLTIEAPISVRGISKGDSVAINGVCLTAIAITDSTFAADVMVQTLRVTTLGKLVKGSPVNLELSARLDSLMGGHIVQGHVDGIAEVVERAPGEKWEKFVVRIPAHLSQFVVDQGSIALDGVSLTVGEMNDAKNEVTVWLIPETLAKTNLSQKVIGDTVNVEVDVLAKYVQRLISKAANHE